MRAFRRFLVVLTAALAFMGSSVQAAQILFWADSWSGTNYWTPAFTLRGDTVTTASSATDLVAQLAAGPWDAVVIAENGNNNSAIWATPIQNYITSGGRVLVNNWYNNATLDSATQSSVVATNETVATINAAGIAAGLAASIGTNPITLTNPGWGTYSQALAPAGGAQSLCDFPSGSCAVLGNAGRTLRLGMLPDTLPVADGARFLANALTVLLGGVSAATSVPTLSEWSLLLMMAIMAWMVMRRRRG